MSKGEPKPGILQGTLDLVVLRALAAMGPRIGSLFRRGRLDRELDDEIANHLAMQEDEFRRAGMDPESARRAALREFGGVARACEQYRERRGLLWIETTAKDVRFALRG